MPVWHDSFTWGMWLMGHESCHTDYFLSLRPSTNWSRCIVCGCLCDMTHLREGCDSWVMSHVTQILCVCLCVTINWSRCIVCGCLCDVTHLREGCDQLTQRCSLHMLVWRDSFMWGTWLMTQISWFTTHDSWIMTHELWVMSHVAQKLFVWRVSFIWGTWLVYVTDGTSHMSAANHESWVRSYVRHMNESRLTEVCLRMPTTRRVGFAATHCNTLQHTATHYNTHPWCVP